MRIFIMALLTLVVGCSSNNSAKMMHLQNENTTIRNLNSNTPNKNTQRETTSAVEHGVPKTSDCNDPKGYSLVKVDNPNREHEGDFIPKDVNVIADKAVVGKIEIPTGSEVKNFSLNAMNKTKDGFILDADWGGWEHHYELKYYFVCKDRNFFFYRLKVNRVNGKDPGEEKNWETKEIDIEPNIPIEQFSIPDYLGDE